MTRATRSIPARSSASSAGAQATISKTGWRPPSTGTSTTRNGAGAPVPSIGRSVSAARRRRRDASVSSAPAGRSGARSSNAPARRGEASTERRATSAMPRASARALVGIRGFRRGQLCRLHRGRPRRAASPSAPSRSMPPAPQIVARAAAARGLPIIHLSTDYVYAGTTAAPHREEAPRSRRSTSTAPRRRRATRGSCGKPGASAAARFVGVWRLRHELRQDHAAAGPRARRTARRRRSDRRSDRGARHRRCRHSRWPPPAAEPGFSRWGIYHFAGAPSTSWHGFAEAIFDRSA